MVALALWSPMDPLLGVVAPLALGASVATALVVDLVPSGLALPSSATLADLVSRGPTRRELSPQRPGTAVLANGGVATDACGEVLAALVEGWPHVVFKINGHGVHGVATVPVVPLLPAAMVSDYGPAVYQKVAWSGPTPNDSMVLPRPSARVVTALLEGRRPVRGRWLRAWRRVWSRPWPV